MIRSRAWIALPFLVISPPVTYAAEKKVTYDTDVLPILREKCFACHGPDRRSGGLRLNAYASVMEGGSSGPAVKAGDPEGSLLYELVTHKQEPHMPPRSPKLPDETLAVIAAWIEGGALENAGSKALASAKPKFEIALSAVAKGKPEGPPPMPGALPLDPVVVTSRANALTALAASPWAPLMAVGGEKQVLLYQSDTLELLGVLPFPEGVPHVLKFSRNGALLLAGGGHAGKSGRVVVWDVKTGERKFEIGDETDAVLAADLSADQTQVALGGPSKAVRVYSTRDGKLVHEIKKHTDWVTALEFSPDGVLLASADRSGGLYVWEAFTGREYFTLRGHTASITDLSWRADGNALGSGSEDGTVRLWEMENGTQFRGWGAGAAVQAVRYARDGRLVTCGRDRVVRLWDGNGGGIRALDAFADVALRAVYTHDGGRVMAGDWSGDIRVWSAADGKLVGHLTANPPPLAEQAAKAAQDVAALEAAQPKLAAAAAASLGDAQRLAGELAAVRQSAADTAAAAKIVAEEVARAKQASDAAGAAMAVGQAKLKAKEVAAKAYADAAGQINAEAEKVKGNKDLNDAVAPAADLAARAAAELAEARKAHAALAQAAQAAVDRLATAQRAAAVTTAAAAEPAKRVAELTPAAKAATDRAAADRTAAEQAAASLAAARSTVARCRAALERKTQTTRK